MSQRGPCHQLILVVSVFNIIVATQPEVHQGSEIQQVNDVNAGLSVHGAFAHPTGPTESMNTPVLAPGGSKKRYWILTQPSKSPGIMVMAAATGRPVWPNSGLRTSWARSSYIPFDSLWRWLGGIIYYYMYTVDMIFHICISLYSIITYRYTIHIIYDLDGIMYSPQGFREASINFIPLLGGTHARRNRGLCMGIVFTPECCDT